MQNLLERLQENTSLADKLEEGLKSGEGRLWSPLVLSELRNQLLKRAGSAQAMFDDNESK